MMYAPCSPHSAPKKVGLCGGMDVVAFLHGKCMTEVRAPREGWGPRCYTQSYP